MPQDDNVFVSKLPSGVTEQVIWKIFSAYGDIKNAKILAGRPYSKTCNALVKFYNESDANLAIETLNGGIPELLQDQMTEGLDCSLARSTEEREREGWDKKESSNASGYQPYSNNKGRTPCKFWQAEGKCKKGNGCHFWHGSDKGKDNSKQPSYRNSPGRTPAQPPARSFSQSTTIRPTPPVTAGNIHPLPRAAPNREQINFLRNITHPLLGTNRSQGEPGSVVAVTNIPIWMDEVGVLFLFAPYGAINSCELDGPGSVRIHYAHARAASNAVLQLNSFRFGAESIGVVVVS